MSDLFGNHIVGFPTRRLIYISGINLFSVAEKKLKAAQELSENFEVKLLFIDVP